MATWGCVCNKRFRHEYLAIRHVKVMEKELCPKCGTAFKNSTNNEGLGVLYCPNCHHYEKFTTKSALEDEISKMRTKHAVLRLG